MGTKTGIEWTDSTWNPLRGCSRVSEGCRNCYAEKVAYRFSGPGQPYEGLAELKNGHASWTGKVELVAKHLLDPLKWRSCHYMYVSDDGAVMVDRPRRIFVNSMSDLFHPNVPDEWIDQIFAVMALCPQHTFQVLTKRPERMRMYCSDDVRVGRISKAADEIAKQFGARAISETSQKDDGLHGIMLSNVWLGVSVENQNAADERIPQLLQTPAAVRFLSCEPLLGPITFRPRCESLADKLHAMENDYATKPMELIGIDWVICGGEGGHGARPMHPDWVRSLRDQCAASGVSFFFKQWGEWLCSDSVDQPTYRGAHEYLGNHQHAYRVGKKAAGSLLDGVEWKQFPRS